MKTSNIAFAVLAVLLTSQAAMASRQGGSSNITRSGQANATVGTVVSNTAQVKKAAKKSSSGVQSSDAAAAAATTAFGKKSTGTVKVAPAPKAERPRVSTMAKSSSAPTSPAAATIAEITKGGLDAKLNGQISALATALAQNSDLLNVAKEIVATHKAHPELAVLSQARIEGLLYISKLPADLRDMELKAGEAPADINTKAYVAVVINAASQAANASGDKAWAAQNRDDMTDLLTSTNNRMASAHLNLSTSTPSQVAAACSNAFEAARIEMATGPKKKKISAEDVLKGCGKGKV